jgi:pilus assembly protein CpaE
VSRLVLATENTDFEDRVRRAFDGGLNGDLRYWRDGMLRGDPARAVTELVNGGADVVAIGPGLPADSALELVRAFDHHRPEISVVMVAEPSPALLQSALRAGARDVIAPDASQAELRSVLELALGAAQHRRDVLDGRTEPAVSTARLITVLCPKGGAGKTTTATNMAVALAQRAPGRVVIVDLDLQFGDVASALHLVPDHTIRDAVDADRLDATSLKVFLTPHRKELFALCAPPSPIDADAIGAAAVERVLELLTASFDYVVVDTASGLDEVALAALELSTDLVILAGPDVPCVRGTRKEVEALQIIGRPDQQWHFVLNRADARTGLGISDIEATIGLAVDVSVPDSRAVPVALNQGTPILESDPRNGASQAFLALVDRIAPAAATAKKGAPAPAQNAASARNGTPAASSRGLFRRSR